MHKQDQKESEMNEIKPNDQISSTVGLKTPPATKIIPSYKIFQDMRMKLLERSNHKALEHNLNNGLYYVVLVDLSGSTIAASKTTAMMHSQWINNFVEIAQTALNFTSVNTAIYLFTCGDGSVFLFRDFSDILKWKIKLNELCSNYNREQEGGKNFHPYETKIIIHIDDINFNANYDGSFAIDVLFNIEKQFVKADLGITESVREALMNKIRSGRFTVKSAGNYVDDGKPEFQLWRLFEK